jgi:hypothetical protein
MSTLGRAALALVAAAVVLVVMAWFDTTVVHDAIQQGVQTFDNGPATLITSLGMIVIAGAVLLLASLGWRSRSVVVGVSYALVGTFFAFLIWIWTTPAGTHNDVPPVLPEPLVAAVSGIVLASVGPLNMVGIVGGGMLIAGVAVIARSVREGTGSSFPR